MMLAAVDALAVLFAILRHAGEQNRTRRTADCTALRRANFAVLPPWNEPASTITPGTPALRVAVARDPESAGRSRSSHARCADNRRNTKFYRIARQARDARRTSSAILWRGKETKRRRNVLRRVIDLAIYIEHVAMAMPHLFYRASEAHVDRKLNIVKLFRNFSHDHEWRHFISLSQRIVEQDLRTVFLSSPTPLLTPRICTSM